MGPYTTEDLLNWSRSAMLAEAKAIESAAYRLDHRLVQAIELIMGSNGKVVVTGVGKSGHVGRKIAATLCSVGTPAVFMHAVEAVHGDLGILVPGDVAVVISRSGATPELMRVITSLKLIGVPLIGILGNLRSPMADLVNVALDACVKSEADGLNLAPTSSSTVALALGDALAAALMQARGFGEADFARLHPDGQLGRNLWQHVNEAYHRISDVACVEVGTSARQVVIAMTQHPLGAACVINSSMQLLGIITDGDLRRALQAHDDIRTLRAADIMTPNPTTIQPDATLQEAVRAMEARPREISVLPVVSEAKLCLGLLRIHDVYHNNQH